MKIEYIEFVRDLLLVLLVVLVVFGFYYTSSNDVDVTGSAKPVQESITHSELHTLAQ